MRHRNSHMFKESLGNNYQIAVTSNCYVEAEEDSYEEGIIGAGYDYSVNIKGTYKNLEELKKTVSKNCAEFDDTASWGFIDGNIAVQNMVDKDGVPANDREFAAWKQGKFKLYNATMYIPVNLISGTCEMTEDDAQEIGLELW